MRLLTNATAAVAIDSLLQNSGRREHDYATRRIRHLGAGLRIAADTPTFLEFSCHSFFSLQFQNRRSPGNAPRGIGTRAWFSQLLMLRATKATFFGPELEKGQQHRVVPSAVVVETSRACRGQVRDRGT